jgi:hypothetical protein
VTEELLKLRQLLSRRYGGRTRTGGKDMTMRIATGISQPAGRLATTPVSQSRNAVRMRERHTRFDFLAERLEPHNDGIFEHDGEDCNCGECDDQNDIRCMKVVLLGD